ncbi:hypothetical protein [Halosimplex amylolyticum]|uniref:hypothetical protein n=1 Tax=Halosimplex amylolyticum TaxID=3396616 RepID=UPI003F572468
MAKSTRPVPNLGSFLSLGSLLLVAGVLAHALYGLNGDWPVGLDGRVGTLFLVVGTVFVGISLVAQLRTHRAARE